MLSNFLKVALRSFRRQKFLATLNMFGLGLGLACAILIFLYVSDELQYDVMHPHYNDTYRIGISFSNPDGQNFDNTTSPGYLSQQIKDTRSEVLATTRIDYIGYPTSLHHKKSDKIILTEEIKWAEPNFPAIIHFDLIKGDPNRFFENHNSMVISETGARRLFGEGDPIGEIITVKHNFATNGREIDVVITGVYKDFPSNSHFKCKYLVNINAFRSVKDNFDNYLQGSRFQNIEFFENYVVFKEGADLTEVDKELDELANTMIRSDSQLVAAGWKANVFLAPIKDLHFDQKNLWENDSTQGNKTYLAIFSSVAILILIIASINYMNLSTARSAQRGREVGLRKALGSKRSQIAGQFFYESFLMTFGSLFIALVLVILLLSPFNQLAHKTFTLASLLNPYMIAIIIGIVILMSFMSGSYPSIYLSGFKPVEVLKGQVIRGRGAELFRKTLVTLQYAVALILVISTFVVIEQMDYMQTSKLNEQGSQLLSIRYGGTAPQNKFEAFREAVLQDPDIEHVTMANHLPRLNYFGFIGARVKFPDLGDKDLDWNALNVDYYFPKTYGLEIISGRDFTPGNPADSSSVILNEAAVRALNEPIEKVIGARMTDHFFDFATRTEGDRTMTVIGVVKDFPFRSMHQAIEPLILNPHLHFVDKIAYVKIPAGKFQEKISSIEKKWREIYGDVGFDYWFVNDEFNRMYESERRMSSLARSFAVLSILITALGIFGLAAYTAEQKSREVGIRKVLGARTSQVVIMFLLMFIKILSIACIIGVPVAYFLTNKWLEGFAYKISISPLLLLGSVIGLFAVTIITVGFETLKAANTNPVDVIRRE